VSALSALPGVYQFDNDLLFCAICCVSCLAWLQGGHYFPLVVARHNRTVVGLLRPCNDHIAHHASLCLPLVCPSRYFDAVSEVVSQGQVRPNGLHGDKETPNGGMLRPPSLPVLCLHIALQHVKPSALHAFLTCSPPPPRSRAPPRLLSSKRLRLLALLETHCRPCSRWHGGRRLDWWPPQTNIHPQTPVRKCVNSSA